MRETKGLQPKAVVRLLFPAVLVGLAVWGRLLLDKLSSEQLVLAGYLPYLLAVVTVVLADQFNRSRFFLLAILTGGTYWLIQSHLQVSLTEADALATYAALSIGMPLALLFLLLVPERGIWNRYGLMYTLVLAVLALAAPRIAGLISYLLGSHHDWLAIWPTENLILPLAAIASFIAATLIGIAMLCWRDDETEVALLTTLAAGFVVLAGFHLAFISLVLFTVAGLVQVTSILRSSHAMAYRDDLTGLLGRRALTERLKGVGPRYCLAMLDVDHFKKFNDTHGHDVGDEVLKLVATRIDCIGAGGTAFRFGGE